jgi:hypothetical protein
MPDYLKKCKVFLNILVNEKSIEDEKEMVAYLKNYKQNQIVYYLNVLVELFQFLIGPPL